MGYKVVFGNRKDIVDCRMKRYEDNDTEDQVTKAIMVADGKVVDTTSLVTLAKKASS